MYRYIIPPYFCFLLALFCLLGQRVGISFFQYHSAGGMFPLSIRSNPYGIVKELSESGLRLTRYRVVDQNNKVYWLGYDRYFYFFAAGPHYRPFSYFHLWDLDLKKHPLQSLWFCKGGDIARFLKIDSVKSVTFWYPQRQPKEVYCDSP